jgi:antitoxin component of MazEF toxin-antitoxin module
MAERTKALVLKTSVGRPTVGSNPTPSATEGALAQLGEHLPCKQEVAGSIPAGSTIIGGNTMNKTDTNEQNNDQKKWIVKVEHLDGTDPDRGVGELCVRLPDELIEQLGWEIGDEVEWEETEICEEWGEHKGFTLTNRSKQFRDADKARKEAVSIDME